MEFTQYDHQRYRQQLTQGVQFSPACRHEGLDTLYIAHCMRNPNKGGSLILLISGLYRRLQHAYAANRLQRLECKVRFFQHKLYGTL